MEDHGSRRSLQFLADKYPLRFLERSGHYLGIYNGLGIDAFEDNGTIIFYVFSPNAEIGEQILEDFSGFTHLREAGISPRWIRGHMLTQKDVDQHGCILELTPNRLNEISTEQFLSIPDCLAKDFRAFGGDVGEHCPMCGGKTPEHVVCVGRTYQLACESCFLNVKAATPDGRLRQTDPVQWGAALSTLLFGTILFAVVWGFLQQPFLGLEDGRILLFGPFWGSVFLVRAVAKSAGGRSIWLSLAALIAILAATLAGNIWGFRSAALAQNVPLTWLDACRAYFQHQLPNNSDVEVIYLIGGVCGAWLGSSFLKTGFSRIE